MLTAGTEVEVEGHGPVTVGRCLGEGGQGAVFEAHDRARRAFALKWYRTGAAPADHADNLAELVERGPPSERFLWPLGLARIKGRDEFGYLMRLRPSGYVDLHQYLSGTDDQGRPLEVSFAALTTLSFQLARSFLKLHALGLCYRDINRGNLFFAPDRGDALICDNDNVGIDGTPGPVYGTLGYMAPEVVLLLEGPNTPGASWPSARTDLHSLAVALFEILMIAHPLDGRKSEAGPSDIRWQIEHLGRDPVFIFDPRNDRNPPLDDTPVRYWRAYPTFIRRLFIQAFTAGLRDPGERVRESAWASAMLRMRDSILSCGSCGRTIFYDWDDPRRGCVRCGSPCYRPLMLEIGRHRIALGPKTKVWTDHFASDHDATAPVAEMTAHPHDPRRWGLRNLTDKAWAATDPDGRGQQVPPGRTIETRAGTQIHFGPRDGRVTQ
ncbi:MAG: protein kinase domain-containing protein [Egibacteraceae bacterium]